MPLMVYSGAAAAQRGLDIMVEALPQLDGVHTGFVVAQPPTRFVRRLVNRANELGVADRVHLLPYVPVEQVVPYLAGADIGVIPIHHYPNHEIALITKFFEYAHARLPMIVSDVRTMAATTREIGQGEVFRAGDLEDFLRAVKAILADPKRYRAAYDRPGLLEEWTWEQQAVVLDGVYERLMPRASSTGAESTRTV
jgi:glycosyltransferase involved in cell wall biosynthesis